MPTHDFDPSDEEVPPPRRAPPPDHHSPEAERSLLGVCAMDAASLLRAQDAGITPRSFHSPEHAVVFSRLLAMARAEQPISAETLILELVAHNEVDKAGGMAALMEVTGGTPTTAHAGYLIERVRELELRRNLLRDLAQLTERAKSGTPLEELAAATAALSGLPTSRKASIAARLKSSRVCASTKPPEPVTRLYLADKPIATPGNLVTLISRAKTGKTAALGAATASIICATTGTAAIHDTFKFRASNPAGHAVIVIDTEQSPYDAWQCYERSLKRSGTEQDPPWLHHHALVGYSVPDSLAALDLLLEQCQTQHGGIFAVILDGVADLVSSVNDEAECNNLVTHLRARSVSFNTPIICVIHSNESVKAGDDGRGHLGKQLIRKAESNLLLKKDGDITTITSDKQRKAPITKADNVAFRWDDATQMHVSCDAGESRPSAGGRKRLHTITEFLECIPAKGEPPMTGTQIHRYAIQIADIKAQTFKDLLSEAAKDGVLVKTFDKRTGYSYAKAM